MSEAETTRNRSATIAFVVSMLLLTASAVTFARSDQSLRVATDAQIVSNTERGKASAATYRANLTIAVVAAASDSTSSSLQAAEAARRALDRLGELGADIGDAAVVASIEQLFSSHDHVVASLTAGEVADADRRVSKETLPALDELQSKLATLSVDATARIDAERASAGQTARASSFVVALIAPAVALWVFRRSAQRRLERERLSAELVRQRDLAEAQQGLISGLSHQLRTPLTGIYGFAEALVDDAAGTPDPDLVREAGKTILGEANKLRAMVDDILVIARSEVGGLVHERAYFDLAAEVAAAVEPFNRSGADIAVDCEPARVCGDRLRTRHVLRNLIDNALRHGAPPVRIIGTAGDGYTVAVEDGGNGPSDSDIFRPFAHSGDEALVAGSLGLGLGVCRALCEGMGVDLAMERVGGTTRFTLRFDANSVSLTDDPNRNRLIIDRR